MLVLLWPGAFLEGDIRGIDRPTGGGKLLVDDLASVGLADLNEDGSSVGGLDKLRTGLGRLHGGSGLQRLQSLREFVLGGLGLGCH